MIRLPMAALVALLATSASAFEAQFLDASDAFLGNPHDVKLSADGKRLYVSDVDNDQVAILDAKSLKRLAAFGREEQNGTHDIDIGPGGRLYVADTHNHRIAIYVLDGDAGRLVGEIKGGFSKPEGVLVAPDGRVYVTGAGSGNILSFRDGKAIAEQDGLSAPHDLAFAPNGDIWVADAGNDRMLRFAPDLRKVGELSGPAYGFRGPRYLDVAADGTLIVADKYSHAIKVVAADGRLRGVIGGDGAGRGPGKFRTPEGVALRGDTVWLSDSGNDRIVRYRLGW